MKSSFTKDCFFSVPKKELFAFHERKDAFSLLTPPSHKIEVLSTASTLEPSPDVVRFIASFLFFKFRFEMVHTDYKPFELFVDQQKSGLFSSWKHEHRFIQAGWEKDPAAMLTDQITFSHPLLPFFLPFVQQRLKGLFEYRHQKTAQELADVAKLTTLSDARVAITGATGLIGERITSLLLEKGVKVIALVRDIDKATQIFGDKVQPVYWDFTKPDRNQLQRWLDGVEGVIHLAGTPLFKQRWTQAFKQEMLDSRVKSTRQLVDVIKNLPNQPKVFISASAVGIYGTQATRVADENSAAAEDLLADICVKWEAEAKPLEPLGVRTVQIRIGIVLSKESGALKELLLPFRFGFGGVLGRPNPWINWIHIEDIARIFIMSLIHPDMNGPFNAVAPHPVDNRTFALTLAKVLKRPAFLRYPVPLIELMIGEAAQYMSGGAKASSMKIQNLGYRFFFSELESAIENVLRY